MTRDRLTLQQWIDRRELVPPPALTERVREVVQESSRGLDRTVPGAALEASLSLLDSLLRGADPSRAGALGLLTADALLTYAFEAAADEPDRLEALGAEAMRRIAAAAAATTK